MSRLQSPIKKEKKITVKTGHSYSKYNLLGPNIKGIIKKHAHILDNCQIMQNKVAMEPYKREKKLEGVVSKSRSL